MPEKSKLQHTINWWEGCIKFTGGTIRPEKTFAYLLDFKFKPNREYFLCKLESLGIELEVKDKENILIILYIIDLAIEIETLGVYLALDGSSMMQFNTLTNKVAFYR